MRLQMVARKTLGISDRHANVQSKSPLGTPNQEVSCLLGHWRPGYIDLTRRQKVTEDHETGG
jgi:hypothetical protein